MAVPKVSIGLPVYNGERYLRSAMESILRQDYTESEMITLDNSFTYPMCIA
jgi:glycosyltransferase involved in cell wall biosynthesis